MTDQLKPETFNPEDAKLAFERAMAWVLRKAPISQRAFFSGAILAAAPELVQPDDPTAHAATAWADTINGRIYVNALLAHEYKDDPETLAGVLAHEALHILRVEHERRGDGRDPVVWNIAADLIMNEELIAGGWCLPSGGVTLDNLVKWEAIDQTTADRWREDMPPTEVVYEMLIDQMDSPPPGGGAGGDQEQDDSQDQPGNNGQGTQPNPAKDNPCGGLRDATGKPIDATAASDPQTRERARQTAKRIAAQAKQMADEARARAQQSSGQDPGDLPGWLRDYADALLKPRLPWGQLLQEFLTARINQDWSWRRPHIPTLAATGGIAPSLNHEPSLGHAVILLDSSGSVSDDTLAQFWGEIRGIMALADRLTVAHFTTTIVGTDTYSRSDGDLPETLRPTHRYEGGTDIAASIRALMAKADADPEMMPDVLIVLSDFYAPVPGDTDHPDLHDRTLWVCDGDTPEGHFNPPAWGVRVYMTND